jgi:hypothetical protein
MKTEETGPEKRSRRRSLDGPAVVAFTTQDDEHRDVRRTAGAHAKKHGCMVILYAADAASLWADPMPNEWDSDGEVERFGDRLTPEDLEFLGRSTIARQVRESLGAGAKASGWLPKDKGIEGLAAYARAQDAHTVFVPASLESLADLRRLLAGGPDVDAAMPRREVEVVPVAERPTPR